MLLKEMLSKHKNNDSIALKCDSNTLTYRQLYNNACNVAWEIISTGNMSPNIGIFLPNSIQYIIAYFAIAFTERVIVPISITSKEIEIKSIVDYCELEIIITDKKHEEFLRNSLKDLSFKVILLDIDKCSYCDNKFEDNLENEIKNIIKIIGNAAKSDDTSLMIHTSGTTSNPKRVMLTHKNLYTNVISIIQSLNLTKNDSTIISLPLYLASANTSQMLTHIYLGASIVLMKGIFMPGAFIKMVNENRVTNFTCVPFMMEAINEYSYKNKHNISSLRFVCFGGGVTCKDTIKQMINTFPSVEFVHMYGQTEATTRITHLLGKDGIRKLGSVGRPIHGVSIRIVDEKGNDVKNEVIGEIIVSGLNVMKGYYKRPDETKRVIKEGWLYTGDLGYMDAEGYLYVVGRKKNIIISGGINIYPEEIEEILLKHESVKEVYVKGKADKYLGEAPIAYVVLKDNSNVIKKELLTNYCLKNMSYYKVPEDIVFVTALDKTPSGKIKRISEEVHYNE